jgi:hypothetical protein
MPLWSLRFKKKSGEEEKGFSKAKALKLHSGGNYGMSQLETWSSTTSILTVRGTLK